MVGRDVSLRDREEQVTASERLRELDKAMNGPSTLDAHRQTFVAEYSKRLLVDALPLIADVVEAAERITATDAEEIGRHPYMWAQEQLAPALTALRDALEEK